MKIMYVLVLAMVMAMDVNPGGVLGMTMQNTSDVASPFSDDLLDSQVYTHSKVPSRSKRAVPAIIGAIAAAVGAGAAVAGTYTLIGNAIAKDLANHDHMAYNRNFEMAVSNHLDYTLTDPTAIPWYGWISSQPGTIGKCKTGALAGHKRGHSATGTSGIASWKIQQKGLTIVVYWDVPYSGCNTVALGLYRDLPIGEPSYGKRYDYFKKMHETRGNCWGYAKNVDLTCNYRESCYSTKEICTVNKDVQLCASINTVGAGKINVTVKRASLLNCDSYCKSAKWNYYDNGC